MSAWTMFVLENSIVALVLAVLTEAISRATRSDRIANLLWMIVLAKFFLPSFLVVELPLLQPQQSSIATAGAKRQMQVLGIQTLDRNQFEIASSIEANKEPREGSTNEAKTASIKAKNGGDNRKTAAEVDPLFAPFLLAGHRIGSRELVGARRCNAHAIHY